MDLERLVRISNTLATEKDRNEAIKFLALNVCFESLPSIVYISKITPALHFEHFLSFGVNPKSLDVTKELDVSQVPIFNRLISSDEVLILPLDVSFFKQFSGVQFEYREGWKSVVVFSIQNTYLVTITFQTNLLDNEDNLIYFQMLKALLAIYLNHVDLAKAKQKHDLFGQQLSIRQQKVLELIKAGLTNIAIAERMGYSESLIKQETMIIYQKLGVLGRKEVSD